MKISGHRSRIATVKPGLIVTSALTVKTPGRGFFDITAEARDFLREAQAAAGALTLFVRHTSASLTIQENADPDVLTDLADALDRLAPENGGWIHGSEGPDDMPAHIKTMLTSCSVQVPVESAEMMLGTWQGIYLIEHRAQPHRREIVLQFIGSALP
ncbi:secondary thiamine-phosphate synthase enzyme YjbQ [[Pseudomonas] carboxydohydrogena]|uniref:Secondary thiamine-phosphate synthase enzyme YjbQ n=1 Tax=Afipia carboxydohydrogena TaxID=290 RepID=A0ABY8BR19_AFICR|nr:secondary thiamine-phosphate synthase enzyme YjbQ [[Pseudomonas] carboxydohydrogena]WEF51781.1 secondary thiamine-phosphate synthase enzyme YjbQ [[Pseudomonas] carboxydohydrogena]